MEKPSEKQLLTAFEHYQAGRWSQAELIASAITQEFPTHQFGWKVLGAVLTQMGRIEDALIPMQKSVHLEPLDAEAHNNLGVTLLELGRLGEAQESFTQAGALQPGYAEAHNNLGNTLKELGRLEAAENVYKKALAMQPDMPALQISLILLLECHRPSTEIQHPIVMAQKAIKDFTISGGPQGALCDGAVVDLCGHFASVLTENQIQVESEYSQIFRRNSVHLDCKRHMRIFDQSNVIPKFCFSCYKVQIEPRSVMDLIKLFVVFDQLELVGNNIRKCMVERRPELSGFYKAFVFCAKLEDANEIAHYLSEVITTQVGVDIDITVKRGCSEYASSFPHYKNTDKSEGEFMEYPANWKAIEDSYDSRNGITRAAGNSTLSGFNLMDALVIRNWIAYGQGIGDPSAFRLNQDIVWSNQIFREAKHRAEKCPFQPQ